MELTSLKGIGEKNKELFAKMGVHNVEELLEFFPRDYELFFAPTTIGEIGYKMFATIWGAFTNSVFERKTGKIKITSASFRDEIGGQINAIWFNSPYIKNSVHAGELYVLRGRIRQKYGVKQIEQPKIYTLDEYSKLLNTMQPVYSLTKGLSNNLIIKAVKEAFETESFLKTDENDPIPESVIEKFGLCKRSFAIKNLHFPLNKEAHAEAVKRMAFEEIFLFIYAMKKNEKNVNPESSIVVREDLRTFEFMEGLPFSLTDAQKRVLKEIEKDMESGFVMNRLVQGDVGSGKTIVALLSLMNNAYAGFQGALMAPTEVLAAQHYENINRMFRDYGIKLNVSLLTGSMTALEKKVVYNALEDGKIDIIIGTHALIQEKVVFKNLGLVITDEQHRFGIKQREALVGKAKSLPHMLVMSATPIPRTLALIVYGGMDVSVVDELPKNRKRIKNAVIDDSLKENAYRLIRREVEKGRQAYIICPLVEYSEGVEAQNVTDYSEIAREVFEGLSVGMLHGQMSPSKKDEIMQKFAKGDIQILVSTTVVEVGVDVPNATVMMIEDANRFGLAALHQLRGRVGRGADQSYCIFVSNNKSKESIARLEILKTSNDGFEIASKDLEMRGPGEFLGIRQSGMLSFKNFDLYRDSEIAKNALIAVNEAIEKNLQVNDVDMAGTLIL